MHQRPLFRLSRFFVASVASATLLFGPLAPSVFAASGATPSKNPAAGAGAGFPVAVVADAGKLAENAYDSIWTSITRAVMVAFFNALQIFFSQIAYDAANYIASAGTGQEPVFFKKGFGKYIEDVASDAAGDFIGSLSSDEFFRTAGFDLCKPKDLRFMLRLQLSLGNFYPGLQGRFQRPRPRCEFQDVIRNWDTFYTTLSNQDVFKNIDLSLNTNANDVGVSLNILNRYYAKVAAKVDTAKLERQEGQGFKTVSNLLSGDVKTPSQVVGESTKELIVRKPNADQAQIVGAMLVTGFQQGALQLLQYTASVFLNTLSSKLLKRVFEGGLGGGLDLPRRPVVSPDQISTAGKTDSRNANIDLRTPNLFKVSTFEVMADFVACPQENRGTWNCTMDQALAQAIQTQSEQGAFTVREAIARGYLHGGWRLIPDARTRENTDPLCHTFAYCAGNLRKMRLMRVLPVGFEFAANSPENIDRCASAEGCVKLSEVVDGFARCAADGGRDRLNPWCHLVDPNWVIALPQQQCSLQGFGETLLTPQLPQRREECQDVQTCLKRNDRGECVGGYGYCMAENTVYRFGADECPARFATCRGYKTRSGSDVSYLRNTLDYGVCSADNAGCLWYATTRNPAERRSENWIGTTTTGPRAYFDKTMESCPPGEEGCAKLLAVSFGRPALNLALNSSFERLRSETTPRLQNWFWLSATDRPYLVPTVTTGTASADGAQAVELPSGGVSIAQRIRANGGRTYTISFFARKRNVALASDVTMDVFQYGNADYTSLIPHGPGTPLAREFRGEGCTRPRDGSFRPNVTASDLSSAWRRYECSFLSAASSAGFMLVFDGNNALLDSVQLEESELANVYQDGVNASLRTVHLKQPPDEFACSGATDDHPICAKFARVCRQNEAGCQGYTDARLGGPEIPAIVTRNDLCPQSCVGYAEFRKMPSAFDLTRDADARFNDPQDPTSTFFIPTTGQSCRQEDVGCEEFTNMEAVAAGGEQKAYFSYLRSCRKPGPDSKTFFTWEGSDVTGYQLRTWSLVKDAATPSGPLLVLKRANGELAFKNPDGCNARSWSAGADADCRQFYDADGAVFYRYFSQTVLSTPDCASFRLSITNRADCELTDGTFNASTGQCLYRAHAPTSAVCRKEAAGCRGYAGTTAGSALSVLNETFRAGIGGFANGTVSNEALLVGDRSLRLDAARNATALTSVAVSTTEQNLYRVTFWAKAVGASAEMEVRAVHPTESAVFEQVGRVTLSPDWQRFALGPFSGVRNASSSLLSFAVTAQPRTQIVFLDEVNMIRIQDVAYVIEESWNTPAECDKTLSGVPLPQAQLGCRAYRDRNNQTLNARQFSRLCRGRSIGCSAFVDTRDTDDVAEQTFVRGDRPNIGFADATTTRPADRYVYLIDEPTKRCRPEYASCRAFGKPRFAFDRGSVESYATVYLKDDVAKYDAGLCRPSESFCEEFSTNASKEYFRDPQNHACEYKQEIDNVEGAPDSRVKYSGWFVTGTSRPCYPELLSDGKTYNVALRGDRAYAGYGGVCEEEFNECTEFRDPNDATDPLHRTGKPYFFLKNEKIDTQSCAGNVDPSRGCILLRDTGDAILKYNVAASYKKFADGGYAPTAPVDCSRRPADPACANLRGTCSGTIVYCGLGDPACASAPIARFTLDEARAAWERSNPALLSLVSCDADAQCTDAAPVLTPDRLSYYRRSGTCRKGNDTNLIVKAKIDRDCSRWLGCSSAETVLDPATNRYRDLCTNLALCDRASEKPGDVFCANYVNRATTATEPILTRGAFFDINRYVLRKVGLGQMDYTGYTVPDAFQTPDLMSRRVAVEGFAGDPAAGYQYRFPLDYRLTAAIPMPPARKITRGGVETYQHIQQPRAHQAEIIAKDTPLGRRYATLNLCRHAGNGRIGYFLPSDIGTGRQLFCYLPVRPESDRFDFQNLSEKFGLAVPSDDPTLQQGYPAPECRAQPETDAPFPASFVTQWDANLNPPKALAKLRGFEQVNACEYGEDCSCAYKRVNFQSSALSKFYGMNAQNIPPGICQGGPRDGLACLPDTVFRVPDPSGLRTEEGRAQAAAIQAANASQTCGPVEGGGRCVPFGKISIIRGVFGQCLERDTTRGTGKDLGKNPCLTWNPSPVIFGEKDPFHYVPTAGYFPPENSGQYYCTSEARPPSSVRLTAANFFGPPFAGVMSKFDYDERWVRANSFCIDCQHNRPGAALDSSSATPIDSPSRDECREASDKQKINSTPDDAFALRLVGSGRYVEQSYSEAFFKIRADSLASLIPVGTSGMERHDAATRDTTISYFTLRPIDNVNETGRLACGYQSDWVDGLEQIKYDDANNLKERERQWRQKFNQNFTPVLSRGNETVIRQENGRPVTMGCVAATATTTRTDPPRCFFKTWETSYRSENQEKFVGIWRRNAEGRPMVGTVDPDMVTRGFEELRLAPRFSRCASEKPYFAVRAVFQARAPSDISSIERPEQISGPWNFVGFWVTTCAGRANDYRYMYLTVDANSAEICRELAEVRSRNSHQDAAFTDRVWKESGYAVPVLGIQYGARFSPFSSALNVKPAGKDPLFQSGGELIGVSRTNPPSFLGSGVRTYFSRDATPKDRWAYLSNLFARIYRVYEFSEQSVTAADRICTNPGRMSGKKCATDGQCAVDGTCDPAGLSAAEQSGLAFCNSLSGINAGLPCAPGSASRDQCHLGAMARAESGGYANLLEACELAPGWRTDGEGDALRYVSSAGTRFVRPEAASRGAFACAADSMRAGQPCSQMNGQSPECPTKVVGRCVKPTPVCLDPLNPGVRDIPRGARTVELGRCAIDGPRRAVEQLAAFRGERIRVQTTAFACSGLPVTYQPHYEYPEANYTGNEYAPCYADTDCNYDEWNFWSETKIPYNKPRTDVPAESFWVENRDGFAWGPIYSVRSSINREFGIEPPDVVCKTVQEESVRKWISPVTGDPALGLCLNAIPLMNNTLTGGYVGYEPENDCPGPGCNNPNIFGPVLRGGAPNRWNAQNTRAGLWPFENGSRVPFLRHVNELRRPPGVGEAGKGKPTVDGNRVRNDSNNGTINNNFYLNLAKCETLEAMNKSLTDPPIEGINRSATLVATTDPTGQQFGRCSGGVYQGRLCRVSDNAPRSSMPESPYSCQVSRALDTERSGLCSAVTDCRDQGDARGQNNIRELCYGITCSTDVARNRCVREAGYHPKPGLCPNPQDEYCGLIAYDISATNRASSINPNAVYPLPTDVTIGLYSPRYLGFVSAAYPPAAFRYAGFYNPRPPRIAAPDARDCPSPGQCPIQRMDAFSFNGQSEGMVSVAGGQHESSLRFYGWASHEQMPIRRMVVDWGDGFQQELPDAKIKNHKPFCGVQKECWTDPVNGHTGLTCQTDLDCPAGAGACRPLGHCVKRPNVVCSRNEDCTVGTDTDTCFVRTYFGNAPEACETNYFEFAHAYVCNGPAGLPACGQVRGAASAPADVGPGQCYFADRDREFMTSVLLDAGRPNCASDADCRAAYSRVTGGADEPPAGTRCGPPPAPVGTPTQARCSRDPNLLCPGGDRDCAAGDRCVAEGLAPVGGCWDAAAHSCRFTPRVLLEDNWGWCTGECRNTVEEGILADTPDSKVRHQFGGCYAGVPLGGALSSRVRDNKSNNPLLGDSILGDNNDIGNECMTANPYGRFKSRRPWAVFQGSIQLRSRQ